MNWDKLVEFIRDRNPEFASAMQGVPKDDVEQCEVGCSISLPKSYVEFLTTMGKDGGDFYPFGPKKIHDFYELIAELPGDDYPADQFFKVSISNNPSAISQYDNFLDLSRSDGDDAPLVMFEDAGDFEVADVIDKGLTFSEHITRRVFTHFELDQRTERATVMVTGLTSEKARQVAESVRNLLEKIGAKISLPTLGRVGCLRRDDLSALVEVRDETHLVRIELGGDERIPVDVAVDQILDHIPGAARLGPTGRLET